MSVERNLVGFGDGASKCVKMTLENCPSCSFCDLLQLFHCFPLPDASGPLTMARPQIFWVLDMKICIALETLVCSGDGLVHQIVVVLYQL